MTDRELLELLVQKVSGIESKFDSLENKVSDIEKDVQDIKNNQLRMEQNYGTKIAALFDGHSLRGDQIEHLQEQLNERLDTIQTDLSYVVGKTAQHERSFIKLNKKAE